LPVGAEGVGVMEAISEAMDPLIFPDGGDL
jgi:hypothetical protein